MNGTPLSNNTRATTPQVLLLELNEVNFDYVRVYAERGEALRLDKLIREHGLAETVSEQRYDHLEPWIQWVTAHTGLRYDDHGVFRLGDIVKFDIPQIWEVLEDAGLTVGAISPMNAKNRARNPAFFMPDPWTRTKLSGGALLSHLHRAVAQVVNDNAQSRLTPASAAGLLAGFVRYARGTNYAFYANLMARAPGRPWAKAMVLDLLLADVFVRETSRARPAFASLFLNAAAHIQHHYMFNSPGYDGDQRNPDWYIGSAEDPVGEVYRLYDRIVGQIQDAFPRARLMLATGLKQDAHGKLTFYWRLKDHRAFLRKIGVEFANVEPRMSRDFIVNCVSPEQAASASRLLDSVTDLRGIKLFDVDNRGSDVFVMLTWPRDVGPSFSYLVGDRPFEDLRDDVVFVAIKNGQHHGTGYFLDTGARREEAPRRFALQLLPQYICDALGVRWRNASRQPVLRDA